MSCAAFSCSCSHDNAVCGASGAVSTMAGACEVLVPLERSKHFEEVHALVGSKSRRKSVFNPPCRCKDNDGVLKRRRPDNCWSGVIFCSEGLVDVLDDGGTARGRSADPAGGGSARTIGKYACVRARGRPGVDLSANGLAPESRDGDGLESSPAPYGPSFSRRRALARSTRSITLRLRTLARSTRSCTRRRAAPSRPPTRLSGVFLKSSLIVCGVSIGDW